MARIRRNTCRQPAPGGIFRKFTYLQSALTSAAQRLRRLLRERFDDCNQKPSTWRNVPPAYALRGDRSGVTGSR